MDASRRTAKALRGQARRRHRGRALHQEAYVVLGGRYRPIRRRRVLGCGEVPEDRDAGPGKQLEQYTSSEVKITLLTLLLLGYELQRWCLVAVRCCFGEIYAGVVARAVGRRGFVFKSIVIYTSLDWRSFL